MGVHTTPARRSPREHLTTGEPEAGESERVPNGSASPEPEAGAPLRMNKPHPVRSPDAGGRCDPTIKREGPVTMETWESIWKPGRRAGGAVPSQASEKCLLPWKQGMHLEMGEGGGSSPLAAGGAVTSQANGKGLLPWRLGMHLETGVLGEMGERSGGVALTSGALRSLCFQPPAPPGADAASSCGAWESCPGTEASGSRAPEPREPPAGPAPCARSP